MFVEHSKVSLKEEVQSLFQEAKQWGRRVKLKADETYETFRWHCLAS